MLVPLCISHGSEMRISVDMAENESAYLDLNQRESKDSLPSILHMVAKSVFL